MKKFILILSILAIVILACDITVNLTPEPGSGNGGAPATEPPITETPLVPISIPVNLYCNEVSLYLEPALGSSFSCETVPESTAADIGYFAINPAYTKITIVGYPLSDAFFTAQISVFPIQRYRELLPDISTEYMDLQGLIAGGVPGEGGLPFLPYFNAAQVFNTQYAVTNFMNGSGIRYLTLYAQYSAPINNHDLFYTYQGLTSDGQYWISAILPISNPILPATGDNPPNGQSWEDFSNNYEIYADNMKAQLNAQSGDSYLPTLTQLDDLIGSINIQP